MLDYIKTALNGIKAWVEQTVKAPVEQAIKLVDSKIVNPDWDVNDPEDPAYVKNRTHYEATESKVIATLAPDDWMHSNDEPDYDYSRLYSPLVACIYGDKYTVIFDGKPYNVECVQGYNPEHGVYQIGFGIQPDRYTFGYGGGHPSGETPFMLVEAITFRHTSPHAIGDKVAVHLYAWVPHEENPTPHTFEIRHEKTTIKQLDKKYLPPAVKLTYTYIVETDKYKFCKIEDGVATREEVTPQEIYEWWSIEEREIMLVSKENAAVKHTVTGISHIEKGADSSVTSLRIYSSAFGGEPWVKVG